MEKLPFIYFRETKLSKKDKKFLEKLHRKIVDFPENSFNIFPINKLSGITFYKKKLVIKLVFVTNFTESTDKIVLEPGYLTLSSKKDIKKLEKVHYTTNCHGILSGFYESEKKIYIIIELTVDKEQSFDDLAPLNRKVKFPLEYRIRFFNPFLDL